MIVNNFQTVEPLIREYAPMIRDTITREVVFVL